MNGLKKVAAIHDISGGEDVLLLLLFLCCQLWEFRVCPVPTAVAFGHIQAMVSLLCVI